MALADPADRRVARHLANVLRAEARQAHARATTRRGRSRFAAGMTATNDQNVVHRCANSLRRPLRQKRNVPRETSIAAMPGMARSAVTCRGRIARTRRRAYLRPRRARSIGRAHCARCGNDRRRAQCRACSTHARSSLPLRPVAAAWRRLSANRVLAWKERSRPFDDPRDEPTNAGASHSGYRDRIARRACVDRPGRLLNAPG